MFCKHFVQTVQTARLPTTKNSTSWQKLSSALTQAFSRADVSVFGPKNHWLLRPQSGPGMLPLWVLQKGNLFDRLHWEKPLPSCPDRNSCNWVPLPGSASEASDGQKGRVTFIKPGRILHAKEWGAGVSKWEWFTEPTLAICKDYSRLTAGKIRLKSCPQSSPGMKSIISLEEEREKSALQLWAASSDQSRLSIFKISLDA